MENTYIRTSTLIFFLILIYQDMAQTTCEEVTTHKSNIATVPESYENKFKNSTAIETSIRQKRQIGYYPYGGYYRPRPIPIILGGIGIGAPVFGRPGFGGRGFGFGRPGFGGRSFGFSRPGFGGRGFGGRGFGGFGGRGFGGGRGGRG